MAVDHLDKTSVRKIDRARRCARSRRPATRARSERVETVVVPTGSRGRVDNESSDLEALREPLHVGSVVIIAFQRTALFHGPVRSPT